MDAISRYYALRKQSRILRRGSLQKQEELQEEHPSRLSCPILRYDAVSFQLKRIIAIQNRHTTPILQTTSPSLSPKTVKHTRSAQASTTNITIPDEANSILQHKDRPHHCRHRSVAAALA